MTAESVILCEGYHDRSFLVGWLGALGCQDLSEGGRKIPVVDPAGRPLSGGQFGFTDAAGRFLRVIPVQSDTRCFSVARDLLKARATRPMRALVIVVDADKSLASRQAAFRGLVEQFGSENVSATSAVLPDGTQVALCVLGSATEQRGVPQQCCLEQVVCDAIVKAYPDRGECVANWLTAVRGQGGASDSAKACSWSYMAGWYAERGCDSFFRAVWEDPQVNRHLVDLLKASRAWEIVADVVVS